MVVAAFKPLAYVGELSLKAHAGLLLLHEEEWEWRSRSGLKVLIKREFTLDWRSIVGPQQFTDAGHVGAKVLKQLKETSTFFDGETLYKVADMASESSRIEGLENFLDLQERKNFLVIPKLIDFCSSVSDLRK